MRTSLFKLNLRYFSSTPLSNKSILISASLGDSTPPTTLSHLTNNGLKLDIMKRNISRAGRKSDMLTKLKNSSYDGIMVTLEDTIDSEIINLLTPKCKIISTMSVGTNHIDIELCNKLDIKIGYTPGILTDTTADLVVGLTLATARNIVAASECVYDGRWGMWEPLWMAGKDVFGSTVGIVGMGRIGYAVAKRFSGFGCKILYTRNSGVRYEKDREINANLVSFNELLKESDFIIPLCPLNEKTKGLFSKNEFKMMKNDAIFINASRGDVVNQNDLINALNNNDILAAGLDVTTPEPLSMDDPLLKIDKQKLTILPHIGSGSMKTRNKMGLITAQNIIDVLSGVDSDTILKPKTF